VSLRNQKGLFFLSLIVPKLYRTPRFPAAQVAQL
jgi:hypothetical protein